MKKSIFAAILLITCLFNFTWAAAAKTVVSKEEGINFTTQIKYPQGYKEKSINETVKAFITAAQAKFTKNLTSTGPGKNSLTIDYSTKFANKNVVSLLFRISAYHRGAAHPDNQVRTLTFLKGEEIGLDELFKVDSDYLQQLATLSYAELATQKNLDDKNLLLSGTKANPQNYRNWYFTPQGIAIVFDSSKVAPNVAGPQKVFIAKEKLANSLRPRVAELVWGD